MWEGRPNWGWNATRRENGEGVACEGKGVEITLTEAVKLRAGAVFRAPDLAVAGTVREGWVLIPDVVEEVDLVLAREERGADAVDGCVAPALVVMCGVSVSPRCHVGRGARRSGMGMWLTRMRQSDEVAWMARERDRIAKTYLVIEPALRLEVIKKLAVCLAAPEFQVRDLEVTPDYVNVEVSRLSREVKGEQTYSDTSCSSCRHHRRGTSWSCLARGAPGGHR